MDKTGSKSEQQRCSVVSLASAYLLRSEISIEIVNDLNGYLDDLRTTETKESYSGNLAGQIHLGEQLIMDPKHPLVSPFVEIVEAIGSEYVDYFRNRVSGNPSKGNIVEASIFDLWSVHSFAGDYNPMHDHNTETETGLSFVVWTKVPNQIADYSASRTINEDVSPNGEPDGCIEILAGQSSARDFKRLRPPQSMRIRPAIGGFLMFPYWLQHAVYPFTGPGERRTVAGNLNCYLPA